MTYEWHDALGNVGVFLVLFSYLLVQLDRIDTKGFLYSFANGLGAALLCISLFINFNMSEKREPLIIVRMRRYEGLDFQTLREQAAAGEIEMRD